MRLMFLTGTAAAAGLALINSLGNLAGYLGPQVVAWLTHGSGDYGPALLALGISMLVVCGTTIAATMPMTAQTTRTSISVKPVSLRRAREPWTVRGIASH